MNKIIIALIFLSIVITNTYSDYHLDTNNDGVSDVWVEEDNIEGYKILSDTNFDGKPDSNLYMNSSRVSVYEETDYNLDGVMDNFYFYEYGYIVRQEVDSNYDGNIDVWVYIADEGKSITKYEKDLDFDGIIDKIKEFEVEKKDG